MTHEDYMKEAIQLALDSVYKKNGGPFGAVVVKDGKIIGRGWNQVTKMHDPTAHAEVTAIRDACKNIGDFRLNGAVMYISCEPCPMCLAALYWSRIDKVYYAGTRKDAAAINFDDDLIYQQIPLPLSERILPFEQMMHAEAQATFDAWRTFEQKIRY
jgi:guanine deaminase